MYDPYAQFTKSVLSNGLEVRSVFWDRPWISVEVIVHSGGREDPLGMSGLAHFVEHVVGENIPNMDFNKANKFFESCGGRADFGSTSYLSTQYRFTVPTDFTVFRDALKIFGSMLLEERIEKEVERERKVITREFNDYYPFSQKLEWDLAVNKALFQGHRLETWNGAIGQPEGFLSVTESDLQLFYDKHYVPANMSLVILGGIPTKELIAELEKSPFGVSKDGVRNPIRKAFNQIIIPQEKKKIVNLSSQFNFKIEHTEYTATWSFPAEFLRQARTVFNEVLYEILFNEIREKRALAYRIASGFTSYQDVCIYKIGGRINPKATDYIDEVVQKCISKVSENREIFERKLKWCKQDCFMADFSGQGLVNHSAHHLAAHHRIVTIKEGIDELEKVTFDHMAEAASLLSSERKFTFITCP